MSALSDRLNQARGDRSVRSIGRAAKGVGESTVIPYFNGRHGTPSVHVLTALAEVLGIPLSELREAAGLPAGERQPYQPPPEADLMSRRQRLAVDELIRSIVETRGVTHDHQASGPDRPAPTARAQGAEADEKRSHHAQAWRRVGDRALDAQSSEEGDEAG